MVPKVIDPKLHHEVAEATLLDVFERGLNRDPEHLVACWRAHEPGREPTAGAP